MTDKIQKALSHLQANWKTLSLESILKTKSDLEALSRDRDIQAVLQIETRSRPGGIEIHRDQEHGFILLAYAEKQGEYRIPHDHGRAWVIYVVVAGEVAMGSYFKVPQPDGQSRLILKEGEILAAGESRIYYPGEIHDTRCVSQNAVILRLTSLDLREEERLGHMLRFKV